MPFPCNSNLYPTIFSEKRIKNKNRRKTFDFFFIWAFSFRMTQIQKMLDKLPDLRYDKCMKSIVSETKAFRWYILFVIVIKYIT